MPTNTEALHYADVVAEPMIHDADLGQMGPALIITRHTGCAWCPRPPARG